MLIHRLTTVTVAVPDVELTSAFYSAFGLLERSSGRFATTFGGEQLHLVHGPRRRLVAVGLGVGKPEDLEELAARLSGIGHAVEPSDGVLRVQDSASDVTFVVEVAPRIDAQQVALRPTSPTGPLEGATNPPVAPSKLGHVVFGSPDAVSTRQLLVDGLGFRVSDELPGGASFLRCSTDHHNVLVQPAPASFLHHTSWQVADVDEIGRGARHLLDENPDCHLWGLGRHHVGSNFFWYFKDPAGNFVEYYSNMDVVDDDRRPAVVTGRHGLFSWGPDVPGEFLSPKDLGERVAEERQA